MPIKLNFSYKAKIVIEIYKWTTQLNHRWITGAGSRLATFYQGVFCPCQFSATNAVTLETDSISPVI
jgi:hypothetical protein